ncbi:MAG TPA: hypothetical protein V6D19_05580 [Stenomitos sp.]
MRILVDDHYWEIVDLSWEGWIAVLVEDNCRTHFRALIPFHDATITIMRDSTGDRSTGHDVSYN